MLSFLKSKSDQRIVSIQLLTDSLVLVVPNGDDGPLCITRESSPDRHIDVLRQLVSEYKLAGSSVNAVLSPNAHKAYLIDKPAVPEEEQAEAAKWRIRDMLDCAIEDAVVDTFEYPAEALRGRGAQQNVRVATRAGVQEVLDVIQASGLKPNKITTADLALSSLVLSAEEEQSVGNVLLYLGPTYGLFLYVRQQQLYLAREFEFPFSSLNEPSQQEQRLGQLTLEIQRSFDYLESQMGLAPPKKIGLSAPDARLPLANMIGGALGIEVENFGLQAKVDDAHTSSPYTHIQKALFAVGAAWDKQPSEKSINLYTEQFHPQREQLGLVHVVASFALSVVVVILLFLWQSASLDGLLEEQADTELALSTLRSQVEELTQKEQQLVLDPTLVKRLENLKQENAAYHSLLGQLGSSAPGLDLRYSTFLESLATHRPEKLWLTKFSLHNQSGFMGIEGVTLDADEIPAYLEGLQKEPIFKSKSFGTLAIEEQVDQQGHYVFGLHTVKAGGQK